MIPALMANSFGQWLKTVREATVDQTTGRPFTLQRIADLMDVSKSKISAWERGQITSISPEDAHLLANILGRGEGEVLRAVGYKVDDSMLLSPDEIELLAAYRRLRNVPILQQGALRAVQAMPAVLGPLPQSRPRGQRTAQVTG